MNATPQENLLDLELPLPFIQSDLTNSFSSVETVTGEKYVIFVLDEEIYAAAAKYITEVIVLPKITPLPKTPEWFLGIANLRGNIISVIDLLRFWNMKNLSPSPKSKLILLNSKNGDSKLAFGVDKLCEIIVLPNSNILSDGKSASDFCGKIKCKSCIAHLLNAEKLFSSLKI
jgi:purine-binding chemotaxis protein CheW